MANIKHGTLPFYKNVVALSTEDASHITGKSVLCWYLEPHIVENSIVKIYVWRHEEPCKVAEIRPYFQLSIKAYPSTLNLKKWFTKHWWGSHPSPPLLRVLYSIRRLLLDLITKTTVFLWTTCTTTLTDSAGSSLYSFAAASCPTF